MDARHSIKDEGFQSNADTSGDALRPCAAPLRAVPQPRRKWRHYWHAARVLQSVLDRVIVPALRGYCEAYVRRTLGRAGTTR